MRGNIYENSRFMGCCEAVIAIAFACGIITLCSFCIIITSFSALQLALLSELLG